MIPTTFCADLKYGYPILKSIISWSACIFKIHNYLYFWVINISKYFNITLIYIITCMF